MNGAYGRPYAFGSWGAEGGGSEGGGSGGGSFLFPALLFAGGAGATAATAAIAAHRAPPTRLELQLSQYKLAAERGSPVLQAQMKRQLMGLAAFAVGGGIALVAIIVAGKAGKKKKEKKQ